MKIIIADSFTKSLDRLHNSELWYKLEFWKNKFYNFKIGIKNLIKYFKIVWNTRSWDYYYILEMLKFQITLLKNTIETESPLQEADETRIPKVEKINKVLLILDNILKDDYLKQFNYNFENNKHEFVPTDKGFELVSQIINFEIEKENKEKQELSKQLEESEWDELFLILKQELKSWWN